MQFKPISQVGRLAEASRKYEEMRQTVIRILSHYEHDASGQEEANRLMSATLQKARQRSADLQPA